MFSINIKNKLKPVYRSTEVDVVRDFYIPVLSESVKYDRSVGYFSSNILVSYIEGLEKFINNFGRMRLLISPFLSSEDGQAIIKAIDPDIKVKEQLSDLFESYHLHGEKSETAAQIFTQLIRENFLEVKIVIPKNYRGLFHEKTSLFYDEVGDVIATTGSNNETRNATEFNLETFSTFNSWLIGQEQYIDNFKQNFETAWRNELKEFRTLPIKDCVSNNIIESFGSNDSISELYKKLHKLSEKSNSNENAVISEDEKEYGFTPYDYQREAAEKWLKLKQGIISFATGEDVIIVTRGENAVFNRVLKLPQNHKTINWCTA